MPTLVSDANRPSRDAGDATDVGPKTACSAEYENERVGDVKIGNAAGYGIVARYFRTAIVEGHAVYLPATTGATTIGVALDKTGVSEYFRVCGESLVLLLRSFEWSIVAKSLGR